MKVRPPDKALAGREQHYRWPKIWERDGTQTSISSSLAHLEIAFRYCVGAMKWILLFSGAAGLLDSTCSPIRGEYCPRAAASSLVENCQAKHVSTIAYATRQEEQVGSHLGCVASHTTDV